MGGIVKTAVATEAYNAVVVTSEPKTLEQRVEGLEEWKRSLPEVLDRRDREVVARLETSHLGHVISFYRDCCLNGRPIHPGSGPELPRTTPRF